MSLTYPIIGGYCMERKPADPRLRTVYAVKAVRGRVITSVGVLAPPAATVTVENVKTHEREHMSLNTFHDRFTQVIA